MVTGLETIGKKWTASNGQVRYYVNDWADMIGLKFVHNKRGKTTGFIHHGVEHWMTDNISERGVKVWIDEDGGIHIECLGYEDIKNEIINAIQSKIDALNPKTTKKVTIQGHDMNGWDTETVETMEDIHAYLRHAHRGTITAYIDGIEFTVPAGIGNRY